MNNPFKFGTIVEDEFFTDRRLETRELSNLLNSENHIILISPRRFGKSSLVNKVLKAGTRPYITINLQSITSVEGLATKILKEIFKLFPWEKVKHIIKNMRIIPMVSANPMNDSFEITFQPGTDSNILLEDAFALLNEVTQEKKLIVVFDEFQEILSLAKGLDKQLRSIMQTQTNINYILLGSQESMMEAIFDKKKSPFYHFGQMMRLAKIPSEDFIEYITDRLMLACKDKEKSTQVANEIVRLTNNHPYYTQQLSFQVWNLLAYENVDSEKVVEAAIERIVTLHDLDFERLWMKCNKTDRKIMIEISKGNGFTLNNQTKTPTSTAFSSLKKLTADGFIIKTNKYEIEDPFFCRWIKTNMS